MIGVEFRTHRTFTAEDADDGCESTVVEMVRYPWSCPRCGYSNDVWDDWCWWCKWDRADDPWLCDSCCHLNSHKSKECETCGKPKPDKVKVR